MSDAPTIPPRQSWTISNRLFHPLLNGLLAVVAACASIIVSTGLLTLAIIVLIICSVDQMLESRECKAERRRLAKSAGN